MKVSICNHCAIELPSRNALFKHLLVCKDNKDRQADSINDNNETKPIRIIEEDDWYRIIVKPQGMATMGKISGSNEETLINSSAMLLPNATKYKKAVPCHRLDRATGGLVICSKSKLAERMIRLTFQNKIVSKRYRAIVPGRIEPSSGRIKSIIDGREAITDYNIVYYTRSHKYTWISTVDLYPITGKKHQLRKHLCHELGHPILGDPKYAHAKDWPNSDPKFQNLLFLWALSIELPHPKDYDQFLDKKALDNKNDKNNNNNDDNNDDDDNNNNDDDDDNSVDNDNKINLNLKNCSMIKCSIDEPEYYKEFRDLQEQEYFLNMVENDTTVEETCNKKIKISLE